MTADSGSACQTPPRGDFQRSGNLKFTILKFLNFSSLVFLVFIVSSSSLRVRTLTGHWQTTGPNKFIGEVHDRQIFLTDFLICFLHKNNIRIVVCKTNIRKSVRQIWRSCTPPMSLLGPVVFQWPAVVHNSTQQGVCSRACHTLHHPAARRKETGYAPAMH